MRSRNGTLDACCSHTLGFDIAVCAEEKGAKDGGDEITFGGCLRGTRLWSWVAFVVYLAKNQSMMYMMEILVALTSSNRSSIP